MSIMDWLRGKKPEADETESSQGDPRARADAIERVDPETGEITQERVVRRVARQDGASAATSADSRPPDSTDAVAGERTIPSVNRERSIQSRVSNMLAIGAILLLGGGFLIWYYSTQFSKAQEARLAAQKATEARASGEMKLSPLGRLDPPAPPPTAGGIIPVAAGDVLGPAPPPPQAVSVGPAAQSGPPQKTPAQLALERRLAEPVVKRGQLMAAAPVPAQPMPGGGPQAPNIASLLGLPGAQGKGPAEGVGGGLASMLQPTPTQAVEAQVVPTRRFLLGKGSFIDCTLETAIDSTYDGMVTCIVATEVRGADGMVVLLEPGTKLVGEKKGEVKQGQGRVFVLWTEARTPTGVVARLDSPGTDELGRTGLPGFVDTHFWDRFGAAILISVIDGTLQAVASSQSGGGGTTVQLSPTGTRDVMTEILRSTVAIPPTVIKNQGDRIQVLVARDVDFRPVYALRTSEQN